MTRLLANGFLLAFLLDSGLSVADELAGVLFDYHGLGLARSYLAYFVVCYTLPMYAILAIDARLPKLVFLALIVIVLWANFYPYPMNLLLTGAPLYFTLAVVQLLFGLLALGLVARFPGHHWLIKRGALAGPMFTRRNLFVFTIPSVAALPVLLLILAYLSLSAVTVQLSAGFLRIDLQGIYLTEKSYRRESQAINLVAMVHIGEQTYYEDLKNSPVNTGTVILTEGVTDRNRLAKNFPSHTSVGRMLGLASQPELPFDGELIDYDLNSGRWTALEETQEQEQVYSDAAIPKVLNADLDIEDLSPETVEYLSEMGRNVNQADSIWEGISKHYEWSKANVTPEQEAAVMEDILQKRNAHLLRYVDIALEKFDNVIIPWGAMHMPELEREIRKQGFKLESSKERLAIEFDLFY